MFISQFSGQNTTVIDKIIYEFSLCTNTCEFYYCKHRSYTINYNALCDNDTMANQIPTPFGINTKDEVDFSLLCVGVA